MAGPTAQRAPGIRDVVVGAARGRLIGVEREYDVLGEAGPVDARRIWSGLPDPGAALDPGDPNARRGPSGGVLTADGRHAEVATPPVVLRSGCTAEVLALAAAGQRHLAAQLPGYRLRGYSTHISVEVNDRRVVAVARLIARRLALPIMLGLDRADSPGLLVRPRPGRLEIGGEFVAGDQLRVAVGLTVGMVLLAEHSLGARRFRLPSLPRAEIAPAVERFGWYVDRRGFGPDLYDLGRDTRLGAVTAGDVMDRLWRAGRRYAAKVLDESELDLVDRTVDRRSPIPLERPDKDDGVVDVVRTDRIYRPRHRAGVELHVLRATWWRAVLEVRGPIGTRWLTVPGRALDLLLDAVDRGALDGDLHAMVGAPVADRSSR